MADNPAHVDGFCPNCGKQSLELGTEVPGQIHCTTFLCGQPDAAHLILSNPEIEHIVTLGLDNFSMQHPLRERISGEILECSLREIIKNGMHRPPGKYRVRYDILADEYIWDSVQ